MHRGSSKGSGRPRPGLETLPLSASRSRTVRVEVSIAREGRSGRVRVVYVVPGLRVRELLRSLGHSPEGSAILQEGLSIPLDTPIERAVRLTLVPTFSGG